MRQLLATSTILLATYISHAQSAYIRVSPDEAIKHVLVKPIPLYPAKAQIARIQGDVILEVRIDTSGTATARRVVTGHPLLVPAAMQALATAKYRPFDVNGVPAMVITFAMVTFGNPANHMVEDRDEIVFQHRFWTLEDSAQEALAKGDNARAETQLKTAWDLLAPVRQAYRHVAERRDWMTLEGDLCRAQHKYDDAEQYYRKALELRTPGQGKDAPETAAALANLGNLFAEEKRYDLARDHATRSVTIYEKNFKKLGPEDVETRQLYGHAIAHQSWTLVQLAIQQNAEAEIVRYCGTVLDFQQYLGPLEPESIVPTCQKVIAGSSGKN